MRDFNSEYGRKVDNEHFSLPYCCDCQSFIFYPRAFCPNCFGSNLEWRLISGRGKVYSYTIVNVSPLPEFDKKIPYIFAIIELEEGVRVASNLEQCSPEEVEIGMPVIKRVKNQGRNNIPVFVPDKLGK